MGVLLYMCSSDIPEDSCHLMGTPQNKPGTMVPIKTSNMPKQAPSTCKAQHKMIRLTVHSPLHPSLMASKLFSIVSSAKSIVLRRTSTSLHKPSPPHRSVSTSCTKPFSEEMPLHVSTMLEADLPVATPELSSMPVEQQVSILLFSIWG
jgi:hypothetical protein